MNTKGVPSSNVKGASREFFENFARLRAAPQDPNYMYGSSAKPQLHQIATKSTVHATEEMTEEPKESSYSRPKKGRQGNTIAIKLHSTKDDFDELAEVVVELDNADQVVEKMLETLALKFPPESVMTIAKGGHPEYDDDKSMVSSQDDLAATQSEGSIQADLDGSRLTPTIEGRGRGQGGFGGHGKMDDQGGMEGHRGLGSGRGGMGGSEGNIHGLDALGDHEGNVVSRDAADDNIPIRYVEVPVHEDIIRHVKKKQYIEVEKRVPRYQLEYVEKIVEVPSVEYVDKTVEVEEVREVMREVIVKTIVNVPKEVLKHVPRIEEKIVENIVEIQGEQVTVDKPYTVHKTVYQPKFHDMEVPTVIAQTLNPIIKQDHRVKTFNMTTYEPKMVSVDVFVPVPVSLDIKSVGESSLTHRVVDVPPAQFNKLSKQMNPSVDDEFLFQIALPNGEVPVLEQDSHMDVCKPTSDSWKATSTPGKPRVTEGNPTTALCLIGAAVEATVCEEANKPRSRHSTNPSVEKQNQASNPHVNAPMVVPRSAPMNNNNMTAYPILPHGFMAMQAMPIMVSPQMPFFQGAQPMYTGAQPMYMGAPLYTAAMPMAPLTDSMPSGQSHWESKKNGDSVSASSHSRSATQQHTPYRKNVKNNTQAPTKETTRSKQGRVPYFP